MCKMCMLNFAPSLRANSTFCSTSSSFLSVNTVYKGKREEINLSTSSSIYSRHFRIQLPPLGLLSGTWWTSGISNSDQSLLLISLNFYREFTTKSSYSLWEIASKFQTTYLNWNKKIFDKILHLSTSIKLVSAYLHQKYFILIKYAL